MLFTRALAIVDAEGLDALTMRRLAADVGVEAASLYHHVRDKQDLLDGVLSVMRAQMTLPEQLPDDWVELYVLVFTTYYRLLVAHPHLLPLAGRQVDTDPANGFQFLLELGIAPETAVELWQSILAVTIGFAILGTHTIPSDAGHLPPELADRMTQWREETVQGTLRLILAAHRPG